MPTERFMNLPFKKKSKIFSSAQQEFRVNGFEHAKITTICELSNIKRRTFYSYFDSLEDLYEYVFEYQNTECRKLFEGKNIIEYLKNEGLNEQVFNVFETYYLSVIQSEYGLRKLYEYINGLPLGERKLLNIFISSFKQYEIGVLDKELLIEEVRKLIL